MALDFLRPKKKNKRSEQRTALNEPAMVSVLTGTDTPPVEGIIIDISESGIGLRLNKFLMRGLPVEVRWKGGSMRGMVQYCRTAKDGSQKVGIRADEN